MTFNLNTDVAQLMARANAPKRTVKLLIIDDDQQFIDAFKLVLQSWPNLMVEEFLWTLDVTEVPRVQPDIDIVLMDERLGYHATGTDVCEIWRKTQKVKFLIGSTSALERPEYAADHFSKKGFMKSNELNALEFVTFINRLLSLLP